MNEWHAFLQAVRANPTDDALRLVLADWLQEYGQPTWAELIRVQLELTQPTPLRPASLAIDLFSSDEHVRAVHEYLAAQQRRPELDKRERELLFTFRPPLPVGWVVGRGLGLTPRGARGDLFFRRGLAERAVCAGAMWVADGDAILADHPVERVRLTSRPIYGEFGRRTGRDGATEYFYSLKKPEQNEDFSVGVWVEYQPNDYAVGRVLLLLLAQRWPGVAFEFPPPT